jgi:type IV pilus assembly protein PilA
MKKNLAKGFTLIELMIVVAIIGILAAIAIPNFLRYQLRAKFAELKTNVTAIQKSEDSIKQSERVLCANAATGRYVAFGQIPAGTPSASKIVWVATDLQNASALDWVVQGGTYGVYQASTNTVGTLATGQVGTCTGTLVLGALGLGLSIGGSSDIDGDGVFSLVAAWSPFVNSSTGAVTAAPLAPAFAGFDTANCAGRLQPTTIGNSQVTNCSADNVF